MRGRFLTLLLILALSAPAPALAQQPDFGITWGERFDLAQEQPRRRTLLDILFGRNQPPPQQEAVPQTAAPRPTASRPQAPAVEIIPKNPGATRLAVFGDSLAAGLARGLARLYANDPDIDVLNRTEGSSGFVRDDYYDWNEAIRSAIAANNFDLAIMVVGINDRQDIRTSSGAAPPLSDPYKAEYTARITEAMEQFRLAGKPLIWVGLPPMRAQSYSSALAQISSLQRSAAFTRGVEFVDIYERFVDEAGLYTPFGPDLNGQQVVMRQDDGIHWTEAGSDRAAFFVDKAVRLFYRGGAVSLEVADPLAGTDAGALARPPYQGLGQVRLLEVAGLITSLSEPRRAIDGLVQAGPSTTAEGLDLAEMVNAPAGRADSFGVGVDPLSEEAPDVN